MPAIRDKSIAYESTTTDSGLTIPMCGYAEGDLLFVIVVSDTGTPTIGISSGGTWNQLFQRVNTASLTVLWKYAAASEPTNITVTSTVNETYSGGVVSVQDVFQGYTSGSPPLTSATTQASSGRFALPTFTTSAANSLILAVTSSSGAAPSHFFAEGILQELFKVDGSAEGVAAGWFFQKAVGVTPTLYVGAMTSAAGAKAIIEVRAPAGGATIIPTYPSADAGLLMMPNPAIGWDGNTAWAANADIVFGTSIAGITANDGTLASVADIGIDDGAFMGFAGLTNATTANQISGAVGAVGATRYNVNGRNVLSHFRHATPVQNQRLSPVGSGRGVWLGMQSGATSLTNWKVWQVHGGDAPLTPGYVQPIIINPDNTDHIASAGTLVGTDVRNYGYWTGGIGALQNQACFGPMWIMDTTTLAGGNASVPVDVPSIVQAAAKNKLRFSSILQGSNQMLCLQAIQFGNGGTDSVYVKVNGAAIEFPSRRNLSKKIVNYNGVDNSVGWTFYPGAGDTIDLAGTAFASANKYHWRIHASASASATYNFAGVALTGAGDVQLRAVTTFSGMAFTDCPTITQNSAVMTGCAFRNSTLLANNLSNISDCDFTSTGTGHAIEITAAGTYSFSANQFTGYGADGTTNAAVYNNSGGAVTINISGGGNSPTVRNGAGASTTVNSTSTVTFTGLPTGCDIVVLTAGTSTILQQVDAHGSTSYGWSYQGTPTVDVGFIKPGYVPYYIRGLALSTSDSSIPVTLTADRNYS